MNNGATIYLEASCALNVLKSMEASTTLCGTKAGAEIHHGGSYPQDELIYNTVEHNQLMEKTISPSGVVDFFEGGAAAEEQTEFTVVLKEVGAEKIKVIKAVREITGLGLKEAKELVDGAPSHVKEGCEKAEAEGFTAQLEDVGAVVELK